MRFRVFLPLALFLSACATGSNPGSSVDPRPWRGEVEVYGALRSMFHEGKTGAMVTLDTLLPDPELYAVGALADLTGEITIVGGRAVLTYPDGSDGTRTESTDRGAAGAALLVLARVSAWESRILEDPIRFEDLDEEIGRLASEEGIDLGQRFPFLIEGRFEDLDWHVIDGSRLSGGGASHEDHLAASVRTRQDEARAILVGFYSAGDQGVFTHMGSRTHVHAVLDGPEATGHVDHVVVPAGTILRLPAAPGR